MTESRERWRRIRQLFDGAMELPADDRDNYLRAECGTDAALLQAVKALISAGDVSDEEFGKIVRDAAVDITRSDATSSLDQHVGKYRLIELLGTGGMGNVYLAERADQQFEHRVAVKLLHPGRRDKDLIRRFRTERQMLANLQHSNISRLLDGGETDSGVPYLVMEYVDGKPIDQYCDDKRLSVRDRLRLFQKICGAIEYAHSKLVVHRDIKPSNILVTDDGEPKLLDFGIAKLLDDSAAQYTVALTRQGAAIMTPEYASPEQVRAEPVSTATDVYSLGVLLYKILCGHMPYRPQAMNTNLARAIVEELPSRPSQAVTSPTQNGSKSVSIDAISAARRSSVGQLKRRLQGDIDNVVLKSLRKEPERRYTSARSFSDDIENILRFRPVNARPASFSYRAVRFVRRHRTGVMISVAVAATLFTSAIQIVQQRDRAQTAALQSEQVVSYLGELFVSASSLRAQSEEITASDLLEAGVRDIESLDDQPQVQARLLAIMGTSYLYIDDVQKAGELMQRSLDIRQNRLPYDAAAIGETLRELSESARLSGNLDRAEQQLRQSLELFIEAHGAKHGSVAYAMSRIGEVMRMAHRKTEAVEMLQRAAAMKEELGEADDEDAIDMYGNLAIALDDTGRLEEAEVINRKVVAASRLMFGDKDPNTLIRITNLGLIQLRQGKYREALKNIEETYESLNEVWPSESTKTARIAGIKAYILFFVGRFDESLAAYEEQRQKTLVVYGEESLSYAGVLQDIGEWNVVTGNHENAIELLEEALAITARIGEDPGRRANSIRLRLAIAHNAAADHKTAEMAARTALSRPDTLGRTTTFSLQRELARSLSWQGRHDEAESLFQESLSGREGFYNETNVTLIPTLIAISNHYRRSGQRQRALPIAQRAHSIGLTITPPGTWRSAFASAEYAAALRASGDIEIAQTTFDKAIADLAAMLGANNPRIADLRQRFAAINP